MTEKSEVTSLSEITEHGGECVDIAIACARKSLDYASALPASWEYGPKLFENLFTSVSCAFPDRVIDVWYSDQPEDLRRGNQAVKTLGNLRFSQPPSSASRNFLYLFCYRHRSRTEGHMVIGNPAQAGIKEMYIYFIAAIPIEKNEPPQ